MVDDSREGWRDALKVLLEAYFYGHPAPVLDVSQLRCGVVLHLCNTLSENGTCVCVL